MPGNPCCHFCRSVASGWRVVAINAPKFHCRQPFRGVGADRTDVDAVHNDAPAEFDHRQVGVAWRLPKGNVGGSMKSTSMRVVALFALPWSAKSANTGCGRRIE
jgi:hypothetical protein